MNAAPILANSPRTIRTRLCQIVIKRITMRMTIYAENDDDPSRFLADAVGFSPRWMKPIASLIYRARIHDALNEQIRACAGDSNIDGVMNDTELGVDGVVTFRMAQSQVSLIPMICKLYGWDQDHVLDLTPREVKRFLDWGQFFQSVDTAIQTAMAGGKIKEPPMPTLDARDISGVSNSGGLPYWDVFFGASNEVH